MPSRHDINIQDGYLFQSLKEKRPLDVVLLSGKQYKAAQLRRFDRFAIVLFADGQEKLIYKHAIEEIGDVADAEPRSQNWARERRGGPTAPQRQRPRTAHWG